jgi:transcriptional regulator with XRE-family HTH domain
MADGELIGDRIRRERLKRQMTQRELADRVHVGIPHISKVEANRENPSDDLLQRLAKELKIDADELFLTARRLPENMIEKLAVDPAEGLAFLRTFKKPRR